MTKELGYTCTGFKDMGLKEGEEVRIMSGLDLHAVPEKVRVIKEYPNTVQLEMEFIKGQFASKDAKPRYIKTCVTKGAMLRGDVIIKRLSDNTILMDRGGWQR